MGRSYDNVGYDFASLDELLSSMAVHGMFGQDCLFNNSRDELLCYSSQRYEWTNNIFDKAEAGCHDCANEIVHRNREIIESLVSIPKKETTDKSEYEPILARLGGIKK